MRVVYDLEFSFTDGERLTLETVEGRDEQSVDPQANTLRFVLHPAERVTEEAVIHVGKLNYTRFTRREFDET